MAGHSRPKHGVASLAHVPATQVLILHCNEVVDARDERGHDDWVFSRRLTPLI